MATVARHADLDLAQQAESKIEVAIARRITQLHDMPLSGFVILCFGAIWAATTHSWIARYIGAALALLGLLLAFYG